MLSVQSLTKRFGEKIAVDKATFSVDKPAMIGIIGRSGAGKSTLLRMMNRLADASDGSMVYEGVEISSLRGADKREWQSRCPWPARGVMSDATQRAVAKCWLPKWGTCPQHI
jgi:phosphonate transport system ATP-binding protein